MTPTVTIAGFTALRHTPEPASAKNWLLSENSRQEIFAGRCVIYQELPTLNPDTHQGCDDSCSKHAADRVVAPNIDWDDVLQKVKEKDPAVYDWLQKNQVSYVTYWHATFLGYLTQWGHRIQLHFLPTYSPETNPIERVWWHLHEEITRNHRCANIEELLDLVFDWLFVGSRFEIETRIYTARLAA